MNKKIMKKLNKHITQTAIATHFKINPSAVSQWTYAGIPASRVLAISKLINGKVSCHEMRPDLFPK